MLLLIALHPGEKGKVTSLGGGKRFQEKMSSLGIHPGVTIQVISNYSNGPLIVKVKDTKFVLGRKMAEKIFIVPES